MTTIGGKANFQSNIATPRSDGQHLGHIVCEPIAASCMEQGRVDPKPVWQEHAIHDHVWLDFAAATCHTRGKNSAHNFRKQVPNYHANFNARYNRHPRGELTYFSDASLSVPSFMLLPVTAPPATHLASMAGVPVLQDASKLFPSNSLMPLLFAGLVSR